jgi:hypothetical protein
VKRVSVAALLAFALLPAADASAQVRYTSDVLEITPAVIDRFITAAQAELDERQRLYAADPRLAEAMKKQNCLDAAQPQMERAWAAEDEAEGERMMRDVLARCGFASVVPRETERQAWERCTRPYEADALRLQNAMREAVRAQNRDRAVVYRDSVQAVMQKVTDTCGPEPDDDPFQHGGAGNNMPEMDPFGGDDGLREAGDQANAEAENRAPRRGNFTPQQYRIVKERVINYLNVLTHGSGLGDYQYGDGETQSISNAQPRLLPLVRSLGAM